jgi:predicted nucleic acid-binding protein
MRIYLDNCCFNRPFDDQTQLKVHLETEAKLFVQQEIINGKYELVWSYILEYENELNPFDIRRETIFGWKKIAIADIEETMDVIIYAEGLADDGIKPKDALHISCAVSSDCTYFITTDKKLLNTHNNEIMIVSPIQFINEMEGD